MGFSLLIGLLFNNDLVAQASELDSNLHYFRVELEGAVEERALLKTWDQTFTRKKFPGIERIQRSFEAEGYISVSFDTLRHHDTLLVKVIPGDQYRWKQIVVDDETQDLLRKAGVNVNRIIKRPLSPKRISLIMEGLLKQAENSGYPFARVQLDSVVIGSEGVVAQLDFDKGPFIKIDSVVLNGDLRLRKAYLTNYLNLKEGSPYSERVIKRIPERLTTVRFLRSFKEPEVVFKEDETKINLFLNEQNASSFDGIIGFLPDNITGELLITGDVQLHLENTLKWGESVDLNWRKLQTNTQELNLGVVTPFVLNSPISLDGSLKIYRRDTLFTDVYRQLGVRYVFGSDNYLRLFVDRQTTDLISTSQYEFFTTAPPFLDRAITSYGIGFRYQRLNDRVNPSKGIMLDTEFAAGNKEIVVNDNLPSVVYDSLDLVSLQMKSRVDLSYFISVVPRLVWHQRGMGATLLNDQLFNNEAFRIGGLKSIRGFDEESIFATSYFILRSELRYQFDRQGYVFGFFDGAWYENRSLNRIGISEDVPYSTGVGLTFGTKAGLFSLSYALGSQQGNPMLLRAAKIHFGFLSLF